MLPSPCRRPWVHPGRGWLWRRHRLLLLLLGFFLGIEHQEHASRDEDNASDQLPTGRLEGEVPGIVGLRMPQARKQRVDHRGQAENQWRDKEAVLARIDIHLGPESSRL